MEMKKRIYEFVLAYLSQHRYPPSMREIAAGASQIRVREVEPA